MTGSASDRRGAAANPLVRRGVALAALLCALSAAGRAQPAHLDEWTTARSPHFEVHSDASVERTAEIVASLEIFRAVFAGLAPEMELRSPAPTRIFAFRDAESHAPYKTAADRRGVKILGQFLSHRDGNYITLNADSRFLGSFAVIYHEYVHYLVQHNFPRVPRWFNEGLAEYYSTFAVEGATAVIGRPVDRHVHWLNRNAELRLEEVLAEPRETLRLNEADKAGRFYAVSWGLVHYLLSAGEEYSLRLADFLARAEEGEEAVHAFEQAFGTRVEEMEQALRRHLAGANMPVAVVRLDTLPSLPGIDQRPARPAQLLTALGDLVAHMGRELEAERHFSLALDYEPEYAEAYVGLGYVRDRQGRLEEAHVLFGEAVRRGPSTALAWLLYGRHLLQALNDGGLAGDGSDLRELATGARDAFAVAVEIDPEFAEARAMLGYAHLFGGLEAAKGIPYLRQAWQLLPGRVDLLFQLLQAYLRSGRVEQARRLADGEIRELAPAEMADDAREEIERWTLIRSANQALSEGRTEAGLELLDQAISVTTDPLMRARMEEQLDALRRRTGWP